MIKINFAVIAFELSSIETLRSVPLKTISGSFDAMDDPSMRFGLIVI